MHAQLLQLCLTLRDPMDHSLAASSIHGRFPVRIPEWVAISSSGDFPHPGLNPCLLHLLHGRQILYLLSHWGSLYNPYFKIYLYLSHYLFSTISHQVGWHILFPVCRTDWAIEALRRAPFLGGNKLLWKKWGNIIRWCWTGMTCTNISLHWEEG